MKRFHRKNGRLRIFILPAAACAVLWILPRAVPAGQAGQDKPLQYESHVTVKLVQVYVTGKKGVPVTDLEAADFEIIDNGRSYPVTHFEKHFGEGEPSTAAPAAPAVASTTLGRKFFLVFDFVLADVKGWARAKSTALKFLDEDIRPTDEIGIVTYTINRGLVLHEYLTTDHARVRALVDGFGVRPLAGRAENLTQYLYTVAAPVPPGAPGSGDTVPDPENQFYENQASLQGRLQTDRSLGTAGGRSYVDQAREFVIALGQLAKVLRYIPGFKNIILFSGGIARQFLYGREVGGGASYAEWTTPEQLASQFGRIDTAQGNAVLRDLHEKTLKEFEASNCPIYSVDVSRSLKAGDVSSFGGISSSAIREVAGADSLRQFAGETGGKFFANTMETERIVEDIDKSTSGYYVLGYSVEENWDGAFHKLKVKVDRRGVDVKTQGGYFNPKPFEEYTRFEKLLHVVDLALGDSPQTQAAYEIPVVAMPLMVKGAPHILVFARASRNAQPDVLGKHAEAYVLLMNEKGDVVTTRSFRLEIPDGGKSTIFPSFLLPVDPGRYVGRIVVRDLDTGRGARGAASAVIPPRAGVVFALDPPLFVVPEKDALDLTSSSGESLAGFFGYDPNIYAPLVGDIPVKTARLQAALRAPGGSAGLEIKAAFIDPATSARTEVPVSVLERSADGSTWLYLTEIDTGELAAGRYTLQFEARDPGTGGRAMATAVFTVR